MSLPDSLAGLTSLEGHGQGGRAEGGGSEEEIPSNHCDYVAFPCFVSVDL